MSDPKYGEPVEPKYGEPVEEPKPVDDVVGSARAGLADAEAASRESAPRDGVSADDWDAAYASGSDLPAGSGAGTPGTGDGATAAHDADSAGSSSAVRSHFDTDNADTDNADAHRADDSRADDRRADDDDAASAAATTRIDEPVDRDGRSEASAAPVVPATTSTRSTDHPDAATRAYDDVDSSSYAGVSASEPASSTVSAGSSTPQPIFVQAPEAPQPRGNRGAAGAIGLLAALAFAVIYLGAALGFGALAGDVTLENIGTEALGAVTSFWLWVPVAVFFLAFWLLGAIINRGRWGHWVIFGLLVGLAAYGGHLLGQLFQAPFWNIAPSQAATLVSEQWLAPLALVALVAGRELTIWFGAWVASRGRRVTELNAEAQREYERTLEAGPQLHRY